MNSVSSVAKSGKAVSSVIDPKAGTHFPGKIFVVPHALDRAVEYFGIDRSRAPMFVMDMLRKSSLIDTCIIGEGTNEPTRLYAYKRTAFVVSAHEDTVVTIYPRDCASEEIRTGVTAVLTKALRAAQRKEAREIKRLSVAKAELAVERAACELRRAKSASSRVIADMTVRIAEIDEKVTQIDAEIYAAKREKTTIANGICAYIM